MELPMKAACCSQGRVRPSLARLRAVALIAAAVVAVAGVRPASAEPGPGAKSADTRAIAMRLASVAGNLSDAASCDAGPSTGAAGSMSMYERGGDSVAALLSGG